MINNPINKLLNMEKEIETIYFENYQADILHNIVKELTLSDINYTKDAESEIFVGG